MEFFERYSLCVVVLVVMLLLHTDTHLLMPSVCYFGSSVLAQNFAECFLWEADARLF